MVQALPFVLVLVEKLATLAGQKSGHCVQLVALAILMIYTHL